MFITNNSYKYLKEININLRNPKVIEFNNNNIIVIGSKIYNEIENKKKYLLYSYLLNENFNIIENSENILNFKNIIYDYKDNINISCWVRDIYNNENSYYLLVEFKINNDNKFFKSKHYLLNTNNFINFEIIKEYDIEDLFFKDLNNKFFTAKIENTNHIWGKYLFNFIIDNKEIQPKFDNIIDYNKDYGHVMHNLEYIEEYNLYYTIISIRHYSDKEENNFYYKIYEAYSKDLINYFNTKEIQLEISNNSKWCCYPWKFNFNNNVYIICNQDDYGKNKYPIIFYKENI